jgi:hypothetical protein
MVVALGVAMTASLVALLDDYRNSVIRADFDESAKVIQDKVISELVELSAMNPTTQAKLQIDLRDEIANEGYQVQVNDSHVNVITDSNSDSKKHKINSVAMQGTVGSGDINLIKNGTLIRVKSQ